MPTAISLFCGGGGCSLGFKEAGYSVLYANDTDLAAVNTYKKNFPGAVCVHDDINNLNFHEVMVKSGLVTGQLDILLGGPPCQGFSTAGGRLIDDPRNYLLKSYLRALHDIQPKWFLMENVEGLLTLDQGSYIHEVLAEFIALGYAVRVEKVYAHEYGVPQRRKRVLIVGNRLGYDFLFPEPTERLSGRIFRNSDRTVAQALADLPSAISDCTGALITDHCYTKPEGIQLARIKALRQGQSMKDMPEHLQHGSFKKRANRRVADGTPTEKRGGAPSGLKRLFADEPCLTITGAATREFIHPQENRPLTVREAARIQTFPDSFVFSGSTAQKIQQIGNAIPPLLAKVFAEHISNDYGFAQYKDRRSGCLLGYVLTKAAAMSPALKKTDALLGPLLINGKAFQGDLFE